MGALLALVCEASLIPWYFAKGALGALKRDLPEWEREERRFIEDARADVVDEIERLEDRLAELRARL